MPENKNKQHLQRRGFSLLELIIVVVIIAVLSAIAVPVYKHNVEKAKRSEVMVTMGYVKSQLDIYYAEEGHYPISPQYSNIVGSSWNYIPLGGLKGTYFLSKYYDYQSRDGTAYRIKCFWAGDMEEEYWVNERGEWSWE
ncbi:MAG: prepilin-type N-terminal cleavage/methylation domain-containing protein [Candidatus Marinimicrobia bacterium]|nr:prepilin-type N-terminal cleavage/methylation domain-containing protein [Candidatus Neomarinimicrobiota bacterium]